MPNKNLLKGFGALWMIAAAWGATAATPWSAETHQLAFGDFNGDGKTDVLYIANDPGLPSGIATSDGTGPNINFQSWASNYLGIPWHSGYYKPIVADFNGDGKADILLQRQSQGDSYLLFSNSAGQITAINQTIAYNLGGQIWTADGHRIVAGDFNGDGKADLFLQANKSSDLSAIFLAGASGTFSSAQQTWGDSYMGFRWSLQHACISAGDFNADGKADLLVQAKPDFVIIDFDPPFPVPTYKPNSFGIVNAKAPDASGALFYGSALQIWSRNYLGLDWSAANFDVVIGNFDGTGGADIFLQGKRAGLQNRMLLAQSGGQFTSGDSLVDATLRTMTADQVKLHAANFDGTAPVGLYSQAKSAGGTNQIAATITGSVSFATHDPNLMNVVTPGTAVGSIPGSFSVDPNGGSSYQIPIAVPPGVAKIQPSLGLVYSSHGGNGALGVGWQLTGISAISRCPTTVAQDGLGNQDGVDFDGNDAFCLDGQRLIAKSGVNGAVGTSYRTEIESFQEVVSAGGAAGNPATFTVRDKNGLTKYYGTQTDSTSEDATFEARRSGATGQAVVWALRRIADRFDNFIEFRYDQEANSLEFRPIEILYGSKLSSAKTVVGRVTFDYTTRNDTRTGYMVGGFNTSMTKRLQKISTFGRADPTIAGANDRVSQYYFNYEYSSTSGLSHLASIILCDGGAGAVQRCVQPTQFKWQYGYRGFSNASVATSVDFGSTADLRMLDADGDGRTDFLYHHTSGNNQGVWLARYASLVHSKGTGNSYANTQIVAKQPSRAFAMDWNNDGYADLVDSTASSGGNYRVLLGSKDGFLQANVVSTSQAAEGLTAGGLGTTVGDFDGDGRQDIAYTSGSFLKAHLNNSSIPQNGLVGGSIYSAIVSSLAPPPPGDTPGYPWQLQNIYFASSNTAGSKAAPTLFPINFDGDGKDDLLTLVTACYRRETGDEAGNHPFEDICQPEIQVYSLVGNTLQVVWADQAGPPSAQGYPTISHIKIGDFNGDGLSDILSWGGGIGNTPGGDWHLDVGTGSKGLNGVPAFQWKMNSRVISNPAQCSDVDYSTFNIPIKVPLWEGVNCIAGGNVTLTEQMLDSAMPLDYNRDGYTDLLIAKDNVWQVLPGGPNGYVSALISTGREARQSLYAALIDDASDGLPDILFPWGTNPEDNWHVYYGRGPAVSGAIQTITDGLGAQTQIQYAVTTATTDSANYVGTVYKGHTRFAEDANSSTLAGFRTEQSLGFPNAHMAGPIPVVYQYVADNGLGTPGSAGGGVRTTLQYWGLKMNRQGRGQLGFSEVRAWNDNSEIETRTRYAQQSFPYIGSVLQYEQRFRDQTTYAASMAAGPDPSSLYFSYAAGCDTNNLCSNVNPQPNTAYNENAGYNRVSYRSFLLGTLTVAGTGGTIFVPYVRKKVEDTHPVTNGVPGTTPWKRIVTETLASSTSTADAESAAQTTAVDQYGNPGATRIIVTNGTQGTDAVSRDEHTTLTIPVFNNDTAAWCLSRLSSNTTVNTKPGTNSTGNNHALTSVTRTSSYGYSNCALTSEIDNQSQVTKTYGYDTYGNVISETVSGPTIPANEVRVSGTYLGDGVTSSFIATQGQFPTQTRNALGHAELTTWDGRFGVAKSITGPNGLTTVVQLDTFGRKTKETPISALPAAYTDSTTYWCTGSVACWDTRAVYTVRESTSDGSQNYTEYDRLGRVIHSHKIGFDGNWVAQEVYFDPLGRPYLSSKPYRPATQSAKCWDFNSYDALGRPISTWSSYTDSECTSSVLVFSSAPTGGRQTQTTYDLITTEGNTTKIVGNSSDSSSYATTRVGYATVNVMGRTRFVRDELASGGCPPNYMSIAANTTTCLQTEYDYDARGNLTYTKQVGGLGVTTASPSSTIESKSTFNSLGQKTQMVDPDMGTWSYTYTPFGEMDTQTDAKGGFTDIGYDKLGRMTTRVEKVSAGGATEVSTTFNFDTAPMGIGKIGSVTTDNGFNEWTTYDSLGRFSQSKRQLDGAYFYTDQGYDSLGRPDVLKYPGSINGDTASGPEADANRVRVKNYYNAYGFLASVQDVATGTTYWRADVEDENGVVMQETLGNGRITKRFYDRPTGYISTVKTGSSTVDSEVQNLEFGFDQAANLRMRKDSTAGVNGGNGIREEYDYDKLYRLKQMRQYKPASSTGTPAVIENYTYDDFGNLLSKGGSLNNYCYIALGGTNDPCAGVTGQRPHAVKRIKLGTTSRDFNFDANGNVTSATNAMFDSVSWYVSNLPKRISKGTKYSEFTYGADGARFKQYLYRASNDTETTIYAGGLYEKLTKVSGGTTTVEHTNYIFAHGKAVTFVKRTGTGSVWLRYPHRDHLGSIVAMTNDSGSLVERSAFDPWGKRTSYSTWGATAPGTYTAGGTGTGGLINGITSMKVGFTDQEHVEELGFVHMNGRIYDNEAGRFLSADPHIQFPMSTQGFNRYAYVGNNPLSLTDPSGFYVDKGALGNALIKIGGILKNTGVWYLEIIGYILIAAGGYLKFGGNSQSWLNWLSNSALTYNISFDGVSSSFSSQTTGQSRISHIPVLYANGSSDEPRGLGGDGLWWDDFWGGLASWPTAKDPGSPAPGGKIEDGSDTKTFRDNYEVLLGLSRKNVWSSVDQGITVTRTSEEVSVTVRLKIASNPDIAISDTKYELRQWDSINRDRGRENVDLKAFITDVESRWNKSFRGPDGIIYRMKVSLEVAGPHSVVDFEVGRSDVMSVTTFASRYVYLRWGWDPGESDSAHEFGHILGLPDRYFPLPYGRISLPGYENDIMSGSGSVQDYDIAVLASIYGKN